MALGTVTGMISIRNSEAEELTRIERKGPIWSLLYISSPSIAIASKANNGAVSAKAIETEVLVVGDWTKTLAFYK